MTVNAHDLLIAIMYISILGMFAEGLFVFNRMKTPLHACLLLSCIAILINTTGYVLQLRAGSLDSYLTALKFSYMGRDFIALFLWMFTARLCRRKFSALLEKSLFVLHIVIYLAILTVESHDLYYAKMTYVTDGLFPMLLHENGIVHHIFAQLQLAYIVCALYWLFTELRREKNRTARRRINLMIVAYILETVLFLIQINGVFPVTRHFDISIFGHIILTILMYVAIFRYNLLGIIDVAREYMIDRLSEGIIAVDPEGIVRYYNRPARELFPKLTDAPEEVVAKLHDLISNGGTITADGKIYTPEENTLTDHGENFGMIYSIVDSTAHKLNEYKLKADADILEMAAKSMKDRLLAAEELVQQDRALRHDRRHFEALLLSLMEDGKADEAKKCLQERMEHEPRASVHYCENATVNAAITHYVSLAKRAGIDVRISANIPFDPGVNEMQLAITISNLLENAIHACEKVPEGSRFIEITAKYKDQLLLEIANSCAEKVPLDEGGHPFADADGHGIGTKSVLAFIKETDSEIRYIAEDHVFKVRMMIG